MHIQHFIYGREASLKEGRLIHERGPEKSNTLPASTPVESEQLEKYIGQLNDKQKIEIRNSIEEFLANDGVVVGAEIVSLSNAIRAQISTLPEIHDTKTGKQIDALMNQLPKSYEGITVNGKKEIGFIDYAINSGLFTSAELSNMAFLAGKRSVSGAPEGVAEGPKGRVATEILEQRMESAKARMAEFNSVRVSMLTNFQSSRYNIPRNQRAAAYNQLTARIRSIRSASGNPVADYWKARKQWEAATGKSYPRHLREKRGDAMAAGPETEAESYNYKIVDSNSGKVIASYKQWTGDYIGSGMTRDEAISIIESSGPTSVSGRNAIIEIDGSRFLAPEKPAYDGGIIANAPTETENRRRWTWGIDPLSRAALDRNRLAARMGWDLTHEHTDPYAHIPRYTVQSMRRPAGRMTVARNYPTQIARPPIASVRFKPTINVVQERMVRNEMMMRFKIHPQIDQFLAGLTENTPDNLISAGINKTFPNMDTDSKRNLFTVLKFIRNALVTDNKMRPEDPLTFEEKMVGFANIDLSGKVLNTMAEYFEKPKVAAAAQKKSEPKTKVAPAGEKAPKVAQTYGPNQGPTLTPMGNTTAETPAPKVKEKADWQQVEALVSSYISNPYITEKVNIANELVQRYVNMPQQMLNKFIDAVGADLARMTDKKSELWKTLARIQTQLLLQKHDEIPQVKKPEEKVEEKPAAKPAEAETELEKILKKRGGAAPQPETLEERLKKK